MNKHFKIYYKKWRSKSLLTFIFFFCISFSYATVKTDDISTENVNQEELVTINKEVSLKELFTIIETRTNYSFFFNSDLKELSKKVAINVTNATVKSVLNQAFKNSDIEYTINGNDILIRKKVTAINQQSKIITGVVSDDLGLTLPSVNIAITGSSKGATTDFDGNFTIEVASTDSLEFSFIGFKTQVVLVGNNKYFEINLVPENNVLDEVIIAGVAAGTSRKKMSVSVAKLNQDDINKVPQTSVSSSLQGKIAGVTTTSFSGSPGSSDAIVLRGATNIAGGNGPMILIDGVIMQGSLADINVDDVASIEVVKGAAASSLYGSQAANGVIVITSKRGNKTKDGKAAITFRSETGFQEVAKYLELSTSHHYYLSPEWLDTDTYTKYYFVDYPSDYVSGWDPRINGNRIPKPNNYQDLPYRVNNDLQKEMFTSGLYSTNYISVAKRLNKANIFMSFENNESQGIIIETDGYKRKSFRLNLDYNISKNVRLSASNNYIRTSNDFLGGGTNAFFEVLMTEPDVDLFAPNIDGQKYNFYPNQWNTQFANPLYDLWKKESTSDKTRLLASYDLKWKLNDLMSFDVSYGFENQDYKSRNYTPKGTILSLNTNWLDELNGVVDQNEPIAPRYSDGLLSQYASTIFNQSFRATLNFKESWGDLDFNGKLSYLFEDNNFESLTTNAENFSLPDYNSFRYIVNANDAFYATEYKSDINAINYFAIASLVYKDRYIFDGLFRIDGSSLFGENQRWHNYFRVSAAYRLTKDIEIPGVQELKFRGAYGTAGLRPPFEAQYETFSINSAGGFFKNTLGNKDLKPSRSNELEIGLEASFLNRFRFEATYAQTVVTDQYLLAPLAVHEGGFPRQWKNAGELESNTFEAMLNANIISNDKFNWDVTLTFDKTRQKITKLNIPEYTTGPRRAFKIREGEVYGGMYGSDFVRTLEQMQQQIVDTDDINNYSVNRDGVVVLTSDIGSINEKPFILLDENGVEKNVKIGDINPDFRLGINTNFSYKAFSMYMLWSWKQGGDIYNGTGQYLVRDNRNVIVDQINRPPGEKKTVDYYQALYDAQALNGFWVEDASFVKLREVSMYYTLNEDNLGKASKWLKQVRMGVIGRNILTFTNYTGYDPEAGYSGFVFDNFGYPNFRNYSLTVEFKF